MYVIEFHHSSSHFYSVGTMGILGNCFSSAIRGMMSKCVAPEELGKVFAILASSESLVPIIASTLYSEVYLATQDSSLPGAPYLLSSGFSALVVIMSM